VEKIREERMFTSKDDAFKCFILGWIEVLKGIIEILSLGFIVIDLDFKFLAWWVLNKNNMKKRV
jgi:hypothetical protein